MADTHVLVEHGFTPCAVTARALDVVHPDPAGLGPFCRLDVEDLAPAEAGVYAWVVEDSVMYVGRAAVLRQIVHGRRMNRAYNDYTYVPASKAAQASSPRVRVNALVNAALRAGSTVTWWWRVSENAPGLEAGLIRRWGPPWNRAGRVSP